MRPSQSGHSDPELRFRIHWANGQGWGTIDHLVEDDAQRPGILLQGFKNTEFRVDALRLKFWGARFRLRGLGTWDDALTRRCTTP